MSRRRVAAPPPPLGPLPSACLHSCVREQAIAATLARERAVLREAVLGAREMAERMAEGRLEYSREEGALLEEKASRSRERAEM